MYRIPTRFPTDIVLFCFPGQSSDCFAVTLESDELSTFSNIMVLYKFQENNFTKVDEVAVTNGNRLATHFFNKCQYVIVAEYFYNYTVNNSIDSGSHVYRINQTLARFESVHTLNEKQPSNIMLWEQKNSGDIFLAVSVNTTEDLKLSTESHVYKWFGTYFDMIDVIKTLSPKCIRSFTVRSTMYLAVANFQNDQGDTDIDSEIYRFNLHEEKFSLHQKLRTHAAVDLKFFCFDSNPHKESFLIVANHFVKEPDGSINYETYSLIYKFSEDDYFIPFQSIQTYGAIQLLPVFGGVGQFLLLIASKFYGVKAYQYDGWRFVETSIRYNKESFGPGISSMRQFQFHDNNVFTIANKNNDGLKSNVFNIVYERDNSLPEFRSSMQSWCTNTLQEVKDSNSNITQLANFIKDISHDDGIYTMNSHPVRNNTAKANDDGTTFTKDEKLFKSMEDNYGTIKKFISDSKTELDKLQKESEDSPSADFKQTENFSHAEFDCFPYPCYFNELHIETLNGENLTLLLENALNLNSDLRLLSDSIPLEFDYVAVQSSVDVNYINNHRLEDLLTKESLNNLNQKVIVRGDVIIDNGDNFTVTVTGAVDEVKISNNSVLTISGDQDLHDKTLMVDLLNVSNLIVRKSFNGITLSDKFLNKRGSLINNISFLNTDELGLKDNIINGINIIDFYNGVLKRNKDEQIVTGYHKYEFLKADTIAMNGDLRQISIPVVPLVDDSDDYSKIPYNYVDGFQNFYEGKQDDSFKGKPNDKYTSTTEGSSLKGITDFSPRSKISDSYTKEPHKKESPLKSHIDYAQEMNNYGDVIIDGKLILKDGTLTLNNLMLLNEHINVTDLIYNALQLDDILIDQEFEFKTPIKTETLEVNEINNIQPESWLRKDKNGTVTGRKLFIGDISFNDGVVIYGKINGIDIKFLERHVNDLENDRGVKSNPDTKYPDLPSASLIEDHTEIINDNEIVLRGTIIVRNNINVHHLQISNDSYIKGFKVQNFIELATNNNVTKNFVKPKTFNGNFTVDDLSCTDIKGFNTLIFGSDRYCKTVVLHQDGKIEDLQRLSITAENLFFTGSLDGVSAADFGKWLLVDGEQEILGEQTLKSVEALNGLKIVSNTVNGINLSELMNNGIRINETASLSGITFAGPIEVLGNIEVKESINGIKIPDGIVLNNYTTSSPIIITGDKILMNNLSVDNIYINSIDNLCQLLSQPNDGNSLIINGSVTFSEEPAVNRLNNVDMQLLFDFTWFNYNDMIINASVSFTDVVFYDRIELQGIFNNIEVEHLKNQYVSLTADQTWSSSVVFAGGIIVKGQLHAKKVNVGRYIDGIMIEQFVDSIVLNGVNQSIVSVPEFVNITILGNFQTSGRINDLNIESDVLILTKDYDYNDTRSRIFVSGNTMIEDVKTYEVLVKPKSSVKIQKVDIENWYQSAVKTTGKYHIDGHKVFKNGISVSKDIKVKGLVNGVKFDKENLLLSYYDQILTGNNSFDESSDLMFNNLYTNYSINNVNINKFIERLVYKNKDNSISGNKIFLSDVSAFNITLPNYFGEINLLALNDDLLDPDKYKAYLFSEEFKILESIKKNAELSMSGQAYLLKGWKKIQLLKGNIRVIVPLKSHDPSESDNIGAVNSVSNKFFLTIHEWNENREFTIKKGSRFSLKFIPDIISPVPTHETKSGLMSNSLFVVANASIEPDDKVIKSTTQTDKNSPQYKGWLFGWNTLSHNTPKYNWMVPMYYPGLLLHVYNSCYVLLDLKKGSFCHLYCDNKWKQSVICTNAIQGMITSDGIDPYALVLRSNFVQNSANNVTFISKQFLMDVWKFHDEELQMVKTMVIENPYSVSAIYNSNTKQYIIAVTSGTNIILYWFNNTWDVIEKSSDVFGDKTTVKMRILPTSEVVLFLASPCRKPSSLVWVGGLSSPKEIPIDVNGSEIKQVIPVQLKDGYTINNQSNDYEYYIVVTDVETAVFQPVYTL